MYLCPPLKLHFDDDNGNPLSYGTLSTYIAGSSVPVQTYADAAGSVLNEAVMTLNERGEVSVFLDPSTAYKFVLKRADGSNVYTTDYVTVLGGGGSSGGVSLTSSDSSVKLAKTIVNGVTIWNLSVAEYVTAAVGTETTRAEAVEAVLGDRITQETTDRTTADTALGNRIAAEEAARIAADDTLQSNINAETTRAEAAEASARTAVAAGANITVAKTNGADGHDIYTVTGVESVPKVEIVSTDASIGVTSSTDAGTNTKTFDLSVAAETKAKNYFIGSTTLAALSDATETTIPFARSAGDFSVSSGTVTIPGTVKLVNLSLRVNIGYTGSATNIDYKKFLVKLYINETASGSWDYYADASAPAFESGSVLSHTSLLSLGASTAKTIRLTITNTDAAADFEYQAQLDLNDETFRSLGGGGSAESDHKVSVDGTDAAGYLANKLIAGTNVTLTENSDGNLVIASSGTLDLKDGAVTEAKLADSAVATAKIADGAVTEKKLDEVKELAADESTLTMNESSSGFTLSIIDNGVAKAKLADDSVCTSKIIDGNVTTDKLADNSVTRAKVANDAVGAAQLDETESYNMAGLTITGTNNAVTMTEQSASGASQGVVVADGVIDHGYRLLTATAATYDLTSNWSSGDDSYLTHVVALYNSTSGPCTVRIGSPTDGVAPKAVTLNAGNVGLFMKIGGNGITPAFAPVSFSRTLMVVDE